MYSLFKLFSTIKLCPQTVCHKVNKGQKTTDLKCFVICTHGKSRQQQLLVTSLKIHTELVGHSLDFLHCKML